MPALTAVLAFVRGLKLPWILVALSLAFAAVQTVRLGIEKRHGDALQRRVNELVALRAQDRANFERAAAEAKAKNLEQIHEIEQRQEAINEATKASYERDLARLRAGGLRQGIATPQGNAGCPAPSADGKAAGKPDAEVVCVPRSLLVRAAEIELGRNALIDWVNEQLKVPR